MARTFIYWVVPHLTDHRAYWIRARTRRDAIAEAEENGREVYGEPTKVTAEFQDTMALIRECLGEGGPPWEWIRGE